MGQVKEILIEGRRFAHPGSEYWPQKGIKDAKCIPYHNHGFSLMENDGFNKIKSINPCPSAESVVEKFEQCSSKALSGRVSVVEGEFA